MKKTSVKNSRNITRPVMNSEKPSDPLRTVNDQEAFYFFEAVDKPTGNVAKNLPDFLNNVRTVSLESLTFHLQRKDFENWIANTLRDSKLAQKLAEIRPEDDSNVRIHLCREVENRIDQLQPMLDVLNGENSVIMSLRK
jgi:DNA-directed RNA polymerase subunit F